MNSAVLIMRGPECIDCNRAALVLFGLSDRSELIGKTPLDFAPERQPDGTPSAEMIQKNIEIALSSGGRTFEWLTSKKNGIPIYLEVYFTPIQLGNERQFQCLAIDITERKRAEQAVKESEANLNSLINNRDESIWSIDRNYRYINFNAYFKNDYRKAYGVVLEMGMHALDILTPELCGFWKEKYDKALAGQREVFEFAEHIGDVDHSFQVSLNPIMTDGWVAGVSALSADITDRKRAEEKLQNLLQEKELILKEVHHRIKNNMGAVMGMLMIQQAKIKDDISKQILIDSANRIKTMEVLYNKLYLSDNKAALSIKSYLPSLVNEIIKLFRIMKPVRTEIQLEDIILDPRVLSSLGIIINELLTNAIKHAFPGRDDGVIVITASGNEGLVILVFQDNGIGMPDAAAHEAQSGFGLLLINSLVQQIKGTLTVERNMGTRFIIKFPVC